LVKEVILDKPGLQIRFSALAGAPSTPVKSESEKSKLQSKRPTQINEPEKKT
jgi:hypothetical protein